MKLFLTLLVCIGIASVGLAVPLSKVEAIKKVAKFEEVGFRYLYFLSAEF